jgi:hypothetical protein
MNWPTKIDRKRIEVYLADVEQLVAKLAANPQLTLTIPYATSRLCDGYETRQ